MREVLSHRNYFQIAESNLELIRGDIWDIEIAANDWPLAVYNPGLDIMLKRLKTVSITMSSGLQNISKDIQGFHLAQNAGRDPQNGSVQLDFIDKEDQAISFLINDWLNQIGDPDTGFGRHKKELVINMRINIYNTLLQKIRYYECFDGILGSYTLPDSPGERGSDLSECSLTLEFQQMKRKII